MSDAPPEGTPDPNPDPAPDPTPDPVPHHNECTTHITALNDRVDSLEQTLRNVLDFKPDSSPVKRPWTHRKVMGG